jgi:hypothetical protein
LRSASIIAFVVYSPPSPQLTNAGLSRQNRLWGHPAYQG